jgi:AICAR transformylase/IMP cyclohydrolase PurH
MIYQFLNGSMEIKRKKEKNKIKLKYGENPNQKAII